jgi:hypothetical protein
VLELRQGHSVGDAPRAGILVGRMVHTPFLGGLGAGTGPGQVIPACVEPCDHPGEAVYVRVASSSSDAYASSVIHNRCG